MGKQTDIGYLAGIIDGEGSITAYTRKQVIKERVYTSCDSRLAIYNTNRGLLEWLQKRWGGIITLGKKSTSVRHKQVWSLNWSGSMANPVLTIVAPYLKLKREQAETYLKLSSLLTRGKRISKESQEQRERLADQITKYKHMRRDFLL